MTERPLLSADELKSIPKGQFVVMKTGMHPMQTRLRLFLEWGISFDEPYSIPKREHAEIRYAGREELVSAIQAKNPLKYMSRGRAMDEATSSEESALQIKT